MSAVPENYFENGRKRGAIQIVKLFVTISTNRIILLCGIFNNYGAVGGDSMSPASSKVINLSRKIESAINSVTLWYN